MLLERFISDSLTSEAVKKALLLFAYFEGTKTEAKIIEKYFLELEKLTKTKEQDKSKGRNPAI